MNGALGAGRSTSSQYERPLAWCTIVLFLLPLSAAWCFGLAAAVSFFQSALTASVRRHDFLGGLSSELGLACLCVVALACAAMGLAALSSLLVPRGLGRRSAARMRRWQVVGLHLGVLVSLCLLVVVAAQPWQSSTVVWVLLLAWPIAVAIRLTWESGQWLFAPRRGEAVP